jgi:8-oxo-dGTP pyrophosphatase MutT (NUDIX family)
MNIEIYSDGISKKDANLSESSTACRAIMKKDDKYCLMHLTKYNIYTTPGGRIEGNESLEECLEREVLEETGIVVKALNKTVTTTEYFVDSVWTMHYFTVEIVEMGKKIHLTDEEIDLGMVTVWKTLEEVLDIFENEVPLHDFGSNIHNREFIGFINSI